LCAIGLEGWISHKGMAMPFTIPVVWRESSNQSSDRYVCLTPLVASGMNRKKQRTDYPNIDGHFYAVSFKTNAHPGCHACPSMFV